MIQFDFQFQGHDSTWFENAIFIYFYFYDPTTVFTSSSVKR